MPLYEYYCEACNQVIEVLVRSTADEPACPECGSDKLVKQLSVAAAPATAGRELPVCGPKPTATCGRPQCGSGCMFD